jgi:hypothetical protein
LISLLPAASAAQQMKSNVGVMIYQSGSAERAADVPPIAAEVLALQRLSA